MSKPVFINCYDVISALGAGIDENWKMLSQNQTGIAFHDYKGSSLPFGKMANYPLIDEKYTKVENLIIQSIQNTLDKSKVNKHSKDFLLILSSTKGNIDKLGNGGFVFFRLYVKPVNGNQTRYGDTSIIFELVYVLTGKIYGLNRQEVSLKILELIDLDCFVFLEKIILEQTFDIFESENLDIVDQYIYSSVTGGAGDGKSLQKINGVWKAALPTLGAINTNSNSTNTEVSTTNNTNTSVLIKS